MKTSLLTYAARVVSLCLLLLMFGCPEETPPPLLADLALEHPPHSTALAMAVDSDRNRVYVGDGQRIRTIDLATFKYVDLGSAEGVFYGIDDQDDLIGAISPRNGLIREIMSYNTPLAAEFATGMAYNPVNKTTFVVDIASPGGAVILYELDVHTLKMTQIGPTGLGIDVRRALCLARDPRDGALYTVIPEDFLFRIDATTGLANQVGYVGSDFDNIQDLAFSPTGTLYGIHSYNPSVLLTLNTTTGAGTFVAELPLSYTFGSLAFKPDGSLWAVDLTRAALVRIDTENGAILTQFESLKLNLPFKPDPAFEGIDSLTFFPDESGGGRIYEADPANDIDALTLADGNGGLLVASINFIQHFDNTLGLTATPARLPTPVFELGPQLLHLVYNPASGYVYGRDQLKGIVYEIAPATLNVMRQIRYVDNPPNPTDMTYSMPLALDPGTARLFVQHHQGDLYVVDLASGLSQKLDYDLPVDGVVTDPPRRRLYIATKVSGSGACLDTLDLDTLTRLNRTVVERQIHMMALDPERNRMAVNAQLGTSARSAVFLYDLETFRKIPFSLEFDSLDVRMALDAANNYLVLTLAGSDPRVRIYGLPE